MLSAAFITVYKLWSTSVFLSKNGVAFHEFMNILIFIQPGCPHIPARKATGLCHRVSLRSPLYFMSAVRERLFYEDVPYRAECLRSSRGWLGKCFGYPRRIRPRVALSKNCIRPEGKRSLRARIVESRSIREERKIGAPLPRDKRNLWPCLHGAPRLKLIRPSSLAFK